jgi:DNA-binding NtrC family response regulator
VSTDQVHDLLLGSSPSIRKVRALIERVAPTDLPVLIAGPTGAGKELVAKAIHARSGRTGKLVSFNVCAIAESMFEDALFGHIRGAFTGAIGSAPGYLREANSGTAFFDEIGGMAEAAQAKLLRAIETHEFRPVGALADVRSDFRLVAAANEDIWQLEHQGRFRADLAHRLSSFVIRVPPLCERSEDVPILALRFLREITGDSEAMVSDDASRLLVRHSWPGNVRELRHVVRSAATLSGTGGLRADDIHEVLSWMGPQIAHPPKQTLANRRLLELLEQCTGDVDQVAQHLSVHRATIYRRLKKIGVFSHVSICQSGEPAEVQSKCEG